METLVDVLAFPFRGSGKYLLLTGAVLTVFSKIATKVPIIGLITWVLITGYFMAVYFEIIQSTATGSEEAPRFANVVDIVGDILTPLIRVIGVALISIAPLFAYLWFSWSNEPDMRIVYGLLCFAILYAPMAMLAVAVLGTLGAAMPFLVLPSIFRAGFRYWLSIGILAGLFYLDWKLARFLDATMFPVGWILSAVCGMYLLMANGRTLGLIYREKQDALNWC